MTRRSTSALLLLLLGPTALLAQATPPRDPDDAAALQHLAVTFDLLRGRTAAEFAIASPNGIDEAQYLRVGGIEQWVTIRGEDRGNPVVLFLHGGPGDATNPWGYAAFDSWLDRFTVVQWDQRGAGRTLSKNGPESAAGLTLERLADDGVELTEALERTLGKERIILVGHSFGSILGVSMAMKRPDLFYAYVGTGQVADPTRTYTVAYQAIMDEAKKRGQASALEELEAVGPPPYQDGSGFAVQRRWANRFEHADFLIAAMMGFALRAPGYTIGDINDWIEGQSLSAQALVPQTSTLSATALGRTFDIPVFVLQGASDFTTPTLLAQEWVASIRAPIKEFVAIEGAGHFAVFTDAEWFVHALATRVEPLLNDSDPR